MTTESNATRPRDAASDAVPDAPRPRPSRRPPGRLALVPRARAAAGHARSSSASALALLSARGTSEHLDPSSYEPEGSRALATLLRAEGVDVHEVRTVAEAEAASPRNTTLLITAPDLAPGVRWTAWRAARRHRPDRARLGGPGGRSRPGLARAGWSGRKPRAPHCGLPAAAAAGEAHLGGITYSVVATATGRGSQASVLCYPADDGGSLAGPASSPSSARASR